MDPLDDIFGTNASGEGNSTIDDDFDALFGNITLPSNSDIDSICEDESLNSTNPPAKLLASTSANANKDDGKGSTSADVSGFSSSSATHMDTSRMDDADDIMDKNTTASNITTAEDTRTSSSQGSSGDFLFIGMDRPETTAGSTGSSSGFGSSSTAANVKKDTGTLLMVTEDTETTEASSSSTSNAQQKTSDIPQKTSDTQQKTSDAQQKTSDAQQKTSDTQQKTSATQQKTSDAQQKTSDDKLISDQDDTKDNESESAKSSQKAETHVQEEPRNVFVSIASKVETPGVMKSIFDEDDMFDFFSCSDADGPKVKDTVTSPARDESGRPPLDVDAGVLGPATGQLRQQGEATPILSPHSAAVDNGQNKAQDLLGDLSGLPDISDMERVEPEPVSEKDMDSWIFISTSNADRGESAPGEGAGEKEGEKEDVTEKEKDEKEMEDTDEAEQSQPEAKKPPPGDDFMDFSILELPGYAHLNLDINKHKRTLSKKGSISRRKRPTRAAITAGGTDSDESRFVDSTEPKPKAPEPPSDDEDSHQEEMLGKGDQAEESAPPPEKKPSPHKGLGIKIPGLLEGLSKAKPFAKKPKKSSMDVEPKKSDTDPKPMDVASSADSPSHAPFSTTSPSKKPYVPPAASTKPSALARMLPVPASSKVLKDSQNKNIVEAEASVKPSALKEVPAPSGQAKLPPLKSEASTSIKAGGSVRTPPPIAKKPGVPSKPKTSPAKNSSSVSSVPTKDSRSVSPVPAKDSSSVSPVPVKDSSASPHSKNKEEKTPVVSTPATPAKKETPPIKAKPALTIPPKPRLKPIAKDENQKNISSSSSTSILENPKFDLSSGSQPLPGIDKTSSDKPISHEKASEKKENIPISSLSYKNSSGGFFNKENKNESEKMPSNSETNILIKSDKDDGGKADLKARKSSFSGITPVSPPVIIDRSAPRKNSITGSAYAPMGFRSTLGSSSSDTDNKPRTTSSSGFDWTKSSVGRQTSDVFSTDSSETKSETALNDSTAEEPTLKSKPSEATTNGKSSRLNPNSVLKEANGTVADETTQGDSPLQTKVAKDKDNDKSIGKDSSPWGVQLRRTEKKTPPSKPTETKETESPVNWRQSLGQRRRSSVQKEQVEKVATDTDKPEWMKALSERRRRLINSGFIAADAK